MARWTLNKSVNQTNKITFHTFCCKNENIFGRFLLWEVEWQKHMFCILGKNVPGMQKTAPWANLVSVGFSVAKEQVSLAGSFSAAIQSCLSPTTAAVLLCIHHHHHHHHRRHHHHHRHHGHHDHLKHVVCFFTITTHRSPHLSFLYH